MTINGNDWDQRPLALAPAMALTLAPPTLVPAMALALVPVPLDPSQDHDCHFSCIFIEVSVTIPVPGYIVRYGIPGRFYWDSSRIPVGTQADSSRIQAGFQWCDTWWQRSIESYDSVRFIPEHPGCKQTLKLFHVET